MRRGSLDVAKRALARHYPDAIGAFVCGSIIRGEGTPTSDIDITVLSDENFEGVHRDSVVDEGWPIEFFVHNGRAQDYFFDQDRKRGMCIAPRMVLEGIMIPEERPELVARKQAAKRVIDAGPPPLTAEARGS